MKFAHRYSRTLESEGFPVRWVHCAISYRLLKKCIKRVRSELADLGLPPEVLSHLWLSDDPKDAGGGTSIVGFYYSFPIEPAASAFTPKLTFIIDSNNDTSHLLSSLSPETREHLCVLLRADPKWLSARRNGINLEVDGSLEGSKLKFLGQEVSEPPIIADGESTLAQEVEIPLFADSEFFRILKGELSALHDLQEQEQKDLDSQVSLLREAIAKATSSSFRRSRRALYAWRDIFRLYMEAQVFFSTDELHSGERTSAVAQQQLVKFQNALSKDSRCKKMGKDGRAALESFMSLNYILLQNLKFQEINRIALRKILKKFDKRTALRAYPAIPLLESLLARNVSKVLCQTISQEILSIVPQLSDYLCPICLNIAFKPVRLRCHHVFCIRCLVIMQRAQQNQCALCRSEVVMEATSDNLDQKLLAFLSTTFPKEAKAKQKENEKAASMDLYGDSYDACCVM